MSISIHYSDLQCPGRKQDPTSSFLLMHYNKILTVVVVVDNPYFLCNVQKQDPTSSYFKCPGDNHRRVKLPLAVYPSLYYSTCAPRATSDLMLCNAYYSSSVMITPSTTLHITHSSDNYSPKCASQ